MSIGFEDLVDLDCKNLMLVDSLNMAFRWKKQGVGWHTSLCSTISSLAGSYAAMDTIVLGDGGSVYRKGLFPEYKGNRNKGDQTAEEKQEWTDFFGEYELALAHTISTYPIMKFKGVEADDLIAYLCAKLRKRYKHIWIISSDRDLDLLVNEDVSRFSLFSKKEFTINTFEEHYGYPLDKHLDVKILNGDSGDNISGIPGVGPKRAVTILNKYGPTAWDVMDSIPLPGSAKYIQELNKFEGFELNYELMDLETYCEQAIREAGCLDKVNLSVRYWNGELDNLPTLYESREERGLRLEKA